MSLKGACSQISLAKYGPTRVCFVHCIVGLRRNTGLYSESFIFYIKYMMQYEIIIFGTYLKMIEKCIED